MGNHDKCLAACFKLGDHTVHNHQGILARWESVLGAGPVHLVDKEANNRLAKDSFTTGACLFSSTHLAHTVTFKANPSRPKGHKAQTDANATTLGAGALA